MKSKKLTKAVLYNGILDEGTVLPKISSSICNMTYLVRVKNQLEYCPKQHEIQNVECLQPPKKEILLFIIQEELRISGDKRVVSFDEKHTPDVDWCLNSIAALNPNHQIFDLNYKHSKNQKGRRGIRYVPKAEDFIFQSPSFSNFANSFYQNQKHNDKEFKDGSNMNADHNDLY